MKIVLIVVAMLMLAVTGAAQDATETDPAPFVRALAAIPAGEYVDAGDPLLTYGAIHEAIATAGLDVPQNWEEYDAGNWNEIDFLISDLRPFTPFRPLKEWGGPYREIVGFDFFEVEYIVGFGLPPFSALVLFGSFDTAAVIDAHTARGYSIERQGESGTLLCPPYGCDTGTTARPEPSYPSGVLLGRQESIFVADSVILNSPDILLLEDMISVHEGRRESLADLPEYQALVAALDGMTFTNIRVYHPVEFDGQSADTRALLDRVPLPHYAFTAAIHSRSETIAQNTSILIYEDRTDAADAASALDARYDLPLLQRGLDPQGVIDYRQSVQLAGGNLQPIRVMPDLAEEWSAVIASVTMELSESFFAAAMGSVSPLGFLLDVTDED